jgi:hypothetical protein
MIWQALLRAVERKMDLSVPPDAKVTKTDEDYYDVLGLSSEEQHQARELIKTRSAPEGTVLVLSQEPGAKTFEVIRCLDDRLEGRERGEAIAAEFLRRCPPGQVKTIAIPGNGSSPLGAAAFGKAVAVATENPVASIVVGQGAFDKWNESFAGAFLMAGPANIYNVADPFLEAAARSNPIIREGLRAYVGQIVDALDESATLSALLRDLIVDEHCRLRDRASRGLDMIVGHSKGNVGLQVALLNFELELGEKIAHQDALISRPVDVVTFGNPVNLPDMMPIMRSLFRYHQFVGDSDTLGMKCSWRGWQMSCRGPRKLDPVDPKFTPMPGEEWLVADAGHHLQMKHPETKPYHMPIEKIIPEIFGLTS